MNSQRKGKRFEREVAKYIAKKFNLKCRRTPQSGGLEIKGDIISLSGIPARYHWEIKNQEKLNIWKALEQAESDCQTPKIPVVVFKRNYSRNYLVVEFEEFINLLLELKDTLGNLREVKRKLNAKNKI